ncbi:MAG: pyruvate kinase [Oscillospiraceae bacterium]|jgi:pyruvate kinase|nr:pyruvate kinase [Oscillospiraceae bacterium]
MLKTKIVCTLGPACDAPEILTHLVRGGMDVARMNFSHGTHEEHLTRLNQFRKICEDENQAIPIMLDTKGPEIRLGNFPGGQVELIEGQRYTLTTEDIPCDGERAGVSYQGLPEDAVAGAVILIDDGLVELDVLEISGREVKCVVKNSGVISSHKSLNLPGLKVRLPAIGESDREDLLFGIEHGVDFVSASFIRKKADIDEIREFLNRHGGEAIHIIAKIESQEGLDNFDEIVRAADGIMVARGDLGVEIPLELIPETQKQMIRLCREWGKPVITATQMLDSMIRSPRPTRAEVTDVANAVYDGTSAVMLSGETASGKYPAEALEYMRRIVKAAESNSVDEVRFRRGGLQLKTDNVTDAIGHATCTVAKDLDAAAIVTVTSRGFSARHLASRQPDCPIIGLTFDKKTFYRLRLYRGVHPMLTKEAFSGDELFDNAAQCAKDSGHVGEGDCVVITAGLPLGVSGTTNMLKVEYL